MDEQLSPEEREIHGLFAEVEVPRSMQRYGVAEPPPGPRPAGRGFGRAQLLSAAVAVVLVGALTVGFLQFHSTGRVGSGEGPTARAGAAMAYDPDTRQVVMFGGAAVNPDAAPSPAVNAQGMPNWLAVLGDTWLWDGAAWTQATPRHSPPARIGAQMAWDPHSHRLILVGGQGLSACGAAATTPSCLLHVDGWAWNGGDWAQIPMGDLGQQPVMGYTGSSVMATDEHAGQIILVTVDGLSSGSGSSSFSSGSVSTGGLTSGTCSPGPSPPPSCAPIPIAPSPCVTTTGAQGTTTTCGSGCPVSGAPPSPDAGPPPGTTCSWYTVPPAPPTTTWTFDGATFHRATTGPASGPVPLAAGIFWSPSLGHVIATGMDQSVMLRPNPPSCTSTGCALPLAGWEWTGSAWQALPAAGNASAAGLTTPISEAGDIARNEVVAFDTTGQTWLGSGSPGTWVKAPVSRSPAGRAAGSMAYDAARGTVVLFGGAVVSKLSAGLTNDTWTWDGKAWTLRAGSEIPVRFPVSLSNPVQGGGSSSGSSGSSGSVNCSPAPPGVPADQLFPPGSPAPGVTPPAIPSAPDTICYSSPGSNVECFSYSGGGGPSPGSGAVSAAAAPRATPGAMCVTFPVQGPPPATPVVPGATSTSPVTLSPTP